MCVGSSLYCFLSYTCQVNAFACEQCRETCNFSDDAYISIDVAVSQIRDEVPSLVELLRERVNIMSGTRSDLDKLLGRVEQEKVQYQHTCVHPKSNTVYTTETLFGKGTH